MVGYEADLNPPIDWKKEWEYFFEKDPEKKQALGVEVLRSSKARQAEYDARPSRPLIGPYHLRKFDYDDYDSRLATPLIQVFSVTLSTDFDDGKPCEIYGSIRVMEGPNHRFHLYNRGVEDSETISEHGTLSLVGPDSGAIIPFISTTLELCLTDRTRDVEVVKGKLNLDQVTEDSYDRLLKGVVRGAHGVAYVYYVVFQFAIYGIVQVTITKDDNDDKNHNSNDVYGSLIAGYANGRMYCSVDEEGKLLETCLFEKSSDEPLRVMVGTPMTLSRNVVVVPAYTSLAIEVNLCDSYGEMAVDCLHFPAWELGSPISLRTKNARVEVQVWWHHAYFYLYKDRFIKDSNMGGSNNENEQAVSNDENPVASFVPRGISPVMMCWGCVKVEVFSVFVGGIAQNISTLCGAIIVDDGSDKFSLYNRDDDCAELLLNGLEVNYRAISNSSFHIDLYLRDPVHKLEVSRGSLGWNDGSLESYMSWYNKRLCTVVRGDDGYAAVHYSILDSAYEAFVEVKLCGDDHHTDPINLYGTLLGRYSDYDYSTSYNKKYYKSRFFDCPRDRSVELVTGSKISLLKSFVAVPARWSFIVEAELMAFGIDNVNGAICGEVEFRLDLDNTISKIILGNNIWIEVSVKCKAKL